jgi:hypothetical protein
VLIQSKSQLSFSEAPVLAIGASIERILDLSQTESDLRQQFNERVADAAILFRSTYQNLNSKFPTLRIDLNYACQGITPSDQIVSHSKVIETNAGSKFSSCTATFNLYGAKELLDLARRQPKTTFEIPMADALYRRPDIGIVALVKLSDFYSFIADEHGNFSDPYLNLT